MKSNVYFDNAASTRLSEAVLRAMQPYLKAGYGNPSSLHKTGMEAKTAISKARGQVAKVLNCKTQEIIFTSGGTESNNLAILGIIQKFQLSHQKIGHIITTSIEHEAVLEPIQFLQKMGWAVSFAPVDKFGDVSPDTIKKLIRKDTVLVSVMYANNETGAIQPIQEIGKVIAGVNRARRNKKQSPVFFHTDACQAGGLLDLNVEKLKVDLLTLNGSKIHGPKGSGILFKKNGVEIEPQIRGGGQEHGLRSGTENTPAIVGFGEAITLIRIQAKKSLKQLFAKQSYLEKLLLKKIPNLIINGPANLKLKPKEPNFGLLKLPSTTNFSIKGVEGEALMYYLDAAGFSVATGSACTTASNEPSHVLKAMGINDQLSRSTIRVSLDYNVTTKEITQFVNVLYKTVDLLKNTKQNL